MARAGVKPEDITDVIITHMHWDHADGMDLFPKARIWLQKDELQYYAGEAWQSRANPRRHRSGRRAGRGQAEHCRDASDW